MIIVEKDILINPLQIESLMRTTLSSVITKDGKERKILEIVMASGAEYTLNNDNCEDVELAMQQIIQQIDVSNGMEILHVKKKKHGGLK